MKIKNYKELAKIAGCGVGTISRYFSGGSISDEMRERINAILQQNDFLLKKNHLQTNATLLIFDKISKWTCQMLQFLFDKLADNDIMVNIVLINENEKLFDLKFQALQQQWNMKIIIFTSYYQEISNLIKKYENNANVLIFGQQNNKFQALYFDFEKIMYQLVTKTAPQTNATLYLSLGTEWKALYRGYFKASNDLSLMTNYLVLTGTDYDADLEALTNTIIDKHIETVICVDEDSYFLVKSIKTVALKIINVNFDPNLLPNYLTANQAIQIDSNWIIDQLITFLSSDLLSNEQQEVPVKIIV
ncbi:hypothetical protein [Spiroplasma sp. SV19]|uniref:hypothetical protein n=1 Tax=Spiroplasma sp. SV19 TaxID=2570468 RepID=UPI0024B86C58|nr:hypothetical protein [Spiroplasma sp. SV19]WHQ36859.1 hypothetical protein E7Y35_03015 [Spiroplasma sp. SV19]